MHYYCANDNAVMCMLGDIQLSHCYIHYMDEFSNDPYRNTKGTYKCFPMHASNDHAPMSFIIPLHRASKWTNIIHSITPIVNTHDSPALSLWSRCLTMKGVHGVRHGFYIWNRVCHLIGIPPVDWRLIVWWKWSDMVAFEVPRDLSWYHRPFRKAWSGQQKFNEITDGQLSMEGH